MEKLFKCFTHLEGHHVLQSGVGGIVGVKGDDGEGRQGLRKGVGV